VPLGPVLNGASDPAVIRQIGGHGPIGHEAVRFATLPDTLGVAGGLAIIAARRICSVPVGEDRSETVPWDGVPIGVVEAGGLRLATTVDGGR